MVDMEFFVTGKNIFDVGFRPGLVHLADEEGVKVHATNIRKENKIRIITSGTNENIRSYHDAIKQRLVPIIMMNKGKKPNYTPSKMKEYSGPDIDWHGYNLQFMSAQLSKTMIYSNEVFNNIREKLDLIHNEINGNDTK